MVKKEAVLVTGGTGFIGRNLLPLLRRRYDIIAPTRLELDLLDHDSVEKFLDKGRFDTIIHLASPTGHNALDKKDEIFERTLRIFTSLAKCSEMYGKMIFIGSGSEYGKQRELRYISEESFGEVIPYDWYGFSRYLMNDIANKYGNIINLRLFACYGPTDPAHKLMPHIIACIKEDRVITLRQDVWFDYLFVEDIYPVMEYFIENRPEYNAYNLCSGQRYLISSIADEIKHQMDSEIPVVFCQEGFDLEYTGSNRRLKNEIQNWTPRPLAEGIRRIIDYENREI